MKYLLSIDAGTSVIKTVIFDTDFKQVETCSIHNSIITDNTGKSEIKMKLFWSLTSNCIKQLIKKTKIKSHNIIGVGVTGNMVGFWCLDKNFKPIRNAILWNDTRSSILFKNKEIINKIYKITGSIIQYGCTIPILKWMTLNEKENTKQRQV